MEELLDSCFNVITGEKPKQKASVLERLGIVNFASMICFCVFVVGSNSFWLNKFYKVAI